MKRGGAFVVVEAGLIVLLFPVRRYWALASNAQRLPRNFFCEDTAVLYCII